MAVSTPGCVEHPPLPVELLDADRIRAQVSAERLLLMRSLDVRFEVDSTNTRLLAAPPPPAGQAQVCLSELQHAGRGRRGRQWFAPYGESLALSIGWSFGDAARALPSLSLAVGVAVARALQRAGARGIQLKWPNDVWFDDRKIGGVLIELRAEADGLAYAVIGIGLNVALSDETRDAFERHRRSDAALPGNGPPGVRVGAVADACAVAPSRNLIAGALLDELLRMLVGFECDGFEPFRAAWTALDALRDRPAQVFLGSDAVRGRARGVDADGALLLESEGRTRRFVSGDVSLRLEVEECPAPMSRQK